MWNRFIRKLSRKRFRLTNGMRGYMRKWPRFKYKSSYIFKMESPKSVKYSLACTFIATILMIPYCEEIYKDDFDYTDWKHVLRLSPFVFVPILSIFTFIGVA